MYGWFHYIKAHRRSGPVPSLPNKPQYPTINKYENQRGAGPGRPADRGASAPVHGGREGHGRRGAASQPVRFYLYVYLSIISMSIHISPTTRRHQQQRRKPTATTVSPAREGTDRGLIRGATGAVGMGWWGPKRAATARATGSIGVGMDLIAPSEYVCTCAYIYMGW